jgi:hypothetical protein
LEGGFISRTAIGYFWYAPAFRSVQRVGTITSYAILGGLHHHYARV